MPNARRLRSIPTQTPTATELNKLIVWLAASFQDTQKPASFEYDRITFFSVGRNASHNFALGIKDGRVYKHTDSLEPAGRKPEGSEPCCRAEPDLCTDQDPCESCADWKVQHRVSEVDPTNLGYIGHD